MKRTTHVWFKSGLLVALLGMAISSANAQFGEIGKSLKKAIKKTEKKEEQKAEPKESEKAGNDAFNKAAEQVKGGDSKSLRKVPEAGEYDPKTFFSSEIRPREHAGLDKTATEMQMQEHLAFLMSKQIEYLNAGDWDNLAKDFQTHSGDMQSVVSLMKKKGFDVVYEQQRIWEIRKIQRHYLYPGLNVMDRNGYSDIYQTGDYDWKNYKMDKYKFYDILAYYTDMAKKEPTEMLRYTTTCEILWWRADGVAYAASFKGDPLFANDPEWVQNDKDLAQLCPAAGIKKFNTFEVLDKVRKDNEAFALKAAIENNTKNRIPKTSLNDPEAVAMATKEFSARYKDCTVVKVFVKSGWNIQKNRFGVPITREKYLTIIAKYPDGHRLHDCRLSSITSNGGDSWSNIQFSVDAVAGNREGYPVEYK